MPFSNQPTLETSKAQDLPILQERYALRRCMAETALGKLYWAQDLKPAHEGDQINVLVFILLPALAQNPVFEQVFGHILPTYQKPMPAMPQVTDDGKTADGSRWMVMRNIGGMLLSERLSELDERGMPVPDAMELLDGLASAIANQRPEGVYGYLEPGSVLLGGKIPCLLTAPVVAALRAAYNSNPTDRSRHTLHSGHISPEVLLGDLPVAEDDTFSIACIAYHLLQGETPFGKQSTLEATVRNISPVSIRKLRPDAWQTLQQGLNLKRSARQKNPAALLRTLQRKQKRKLLLPIAALVSAGAVAFSTYHLLSSLGPSNKHEEQALPLQESNTGHSPDAENTAPLNTQGVGTAENQASIAQHGDKPAADSAVAGQTLDGDNDLNSLQEKAADAIRKGKLASTDPNSPAAIDFLRKAVMLEPDNIKTRKLLAQMVNDQQTEAENQLAVGKAEEAGKLLAATDRLITEFTLNDSLKRQVSLEQTQREAAQATDNATTGVNNVDADSADYLERAQHAIELGNLNDSDERSESAVSYLSTLLDKSPNQPEARSLMTKVATLQQEKAVSSLQKRDTDTARTWLDHSQSLISKYKLEGLVEEQIALEKRFRDTLAMGVFKPGSEPEEDAGTPASATASKPAPTTSGAASNSVTSRPQAPAETSAEPATNTIRRSPTAAEPTHETENPEAAEAAAQAAPVEIHVPADIPVQSAREIPPGTRVTPAPVTTELPPVRLDTPPAPTPAAPPKTVTFEVPANASGNGNTFTPDVPNLIEVPLDVIDEGLSTKGKQNR
ncbi:hypothetical protein VSS37_17885 [Candidatus Thiothrix sp. Deng01]|uniref:Protein kinase domain-containing protein n=1 Tax=Candidatus Thiothrix phosphatis TaxID=3112415 RepID=A0ABU6D1A5_9GAMM|nr:hypothetical protein [Candidatus Thiothrix sp. Deng01]MEB4592854.1 hypothetical protein [Candidatus Thiothrix sp. Deng01]